MTGTEKIIQRIQADSARKCADIIAQASRQAIEITASAVAEGEKLAAGAAEKAQALARQAEGASRSSARQKAGLLILEAKTQAVSETLSAAAQALKDLPEERYFGALAALAAENAMPGTGEMRLSRRDLDRLPQGFEAQIIAALTGKNARVAISTRPADTGGGFILVYGNIEVNCTFDALMQAKSEQLKETVCGIIFSA